MMSIAAIGCDPGSKAPVSTDGGANGSLILASPGKPTLGVLRPGQVAETEISLRSVGTGAVRIAKFVASCPCVTISPGSVEIPPGESAVLKVKFDPSAEPAFRGELAVEVAGMRSDETPAFRCTLNLAVSSEPE